MRMPIRILGWNLHLYLVVDQKKMKMIDVDYSMRMGYSAPRNNMHEYKVYGIVIQMFDPYFVKNLQQAPRDKSWPIELINHNYMTFLLHQIKYMLGTSRTNQY
jgi:hypothetical protein